LLDQALFVRLSRNPSLIREALADGTTIVDIDEIRKVPEPLGAVGADLTPGSPPSY